MAKYNAKLSDKYCKRHRDLDKQVMEVLGKMSFAHGEELQALGKQYRRLRVSRNRAFKAWMRQCDLLIGELQQLRKEREQKGVE